VFDKHTAGEAASHEPAAEKHAPAKLFLASSNCGKLREYCSLAETFSSPRPIALELLPGIDRLPAFAENAPTFAENAAGKALHYSRFAEGLVFADDSGLVVPALGGAPGVLSARYAGENAGDAGRVRKLLEELREKQGTARQGYFVCVIALARRGKVLAVVSDRAGGKILDAPRGQCGFGYDPVFFSPVLGKTFAEQSLSEKNQHSHRGKAFRKLRDFLSSLSPEHGVM
jgi:XTP/dITP diphosphohydrolase